MRLTATTLLTILSASLIGASTTATVPETRNATAIKTRQSKEIIYLAQCDRFKTFRRWASYKVLYGLWYSDWEQSQGYQAPEAWTDQYFNADATGPLALEGGEHALKFLQSGDTITTHIQANGLSVGKDEYAGYLVRSPAGSNGANDARWGCRRDDDRMLFKWFKLPDLPEGDSYIWLTCDSSLYYCSPE